MRWSLLVLLLSGAACGDAAANRGRDRDRLSGFRQWAEAQRSVNHIDVRAVADSLKTWTLVNVRFRKDTEEQRFIFANPEAWSALQRGATEYGDDAMFAKVAFKAREDAAFPVSLQPSELVRVQLMKKSRGDASSFNGWLYALYVRGAEDPRSANLAIDDVKDQRVCHGCHTLVKDRDYVFSRPAFLESAEPERTPFAVEFHDRFQSRYVELLPPRAQAIVRALLPDGPRTVKYGTMPLFLGAQAESTGPLVELAVRDGAPYLLVDEERSQFVLAAPAPPEAHCRNPARVFVSTSDRDRARRLIRDQYCDGKGVTHVLDAWPAELP